MPIIIKDHNGTEYDLHSLPESTQLRFANAGLSHLLKNECDSAVTSRIRRELVAQGAKAEDIAKDRNVVAAFRDANGEQVAKWLAEYQDAKVAAMVAGTLGIRAASVAVDPLTREVMSIARDEAKAIMRLFKQPWPKDGETVNVGGDDLSADDLVENWLNGVDPNGSYGKPGEENRPRIEREAQRRLKVKTDKAKAAASAQGAGLAALFGGKAVA